MHPIRTIATLGFLGLAAPAFAQTPSPADTLLNATHDTLVSQTTQPAAAPVSPAATLPNGASAITENFQDWTLNCAIQGAAKVCSIGQAQGNNQTGQQVFAIELRAPKDGVGEGVLLLPFGLAVREAVALKIDDKTLGQGAHFTTCIPTGCIVPISLPAEALNALKTGTSLIATAPTLDQAQPAATFTVSLAGITAALARVTELAQ